METIHQSPNYSRNMELPTTVKRRNRCPSTPSSSFSILNSDNRTAYNKNAYDDKALVSYNRTLKRSSIPQLIVGECNSCQRKLVAISRLQLPSCQHEFCADCLAQGFPDSAISLFCPICHEPHIVPPIGILAFGPSPQPIFTQRPFIKLKSATNTSSKHPESYFLSSAPSASFLLRDPHESRGPFTKPKSPNNRIGRPRKTSGGAGKNTKMNSSFGANDSGCDTTTTQHDISLSFTKCTTCSTPADVRMKCETCDGAYFCASCGVKHKTETIQEGKDHLVTEMDPNILSPGGITSGYVSGVGGAFWVCSVHQSMDLRLYCADCQLPLCDYCVDTTYAHSSHVVVVLKDALSQQRATMTELLQKLTENLSELESKKPPKKFQTSSSRANSKNSQLATDLLDDCFESLTENLESRRKQIIDMQSEEETVERLLKKEKRFWKRRINEIMNVCDQAELKTSDNGHDSGSDGKLILQSVRKSRSPTASVKDSELQLSISCLREFTQKLCDYLKVAEITDIGAEETDSNKDDSASSVLIGQNDSSRQISVENGDPSSSNSNSESNSEDDRSSVLFYPLYLKSLGEVINRLENLNAQLQLDAEASAHGEGLRYCCVNKSTNLTLTARSLKTGRPVKVSKDRVQAEVHSKLGNKICDVTVTSTDPDAPGVFNLSYCISSQGSFLLSIKLLDKHIRGSPFSIKAVTQNQYRVQGCSIHSKSKSRSSRSSTCSGGSRHEEPLQVDFEFVREASQPDDLTYRTLYGPAEDDLLLKVGCRGRGSGRFTNPQDICCTSEGNIVVSDSTSVKIQIFNDEGECVNKFGSQGREAGCLRRPTGIAIVDSHRLAVADYDNRWVNIFNINGQFLQKFGTGKMLGPKGIAVDRHGRIVIVDNKGSCVFVYSSQGKFIRKFGSRGNKPHQMAGPHYVAVGPNNNHLYVTDFHHHCVKVFDINGEFQFSFGSNGTANGQFNAPTGIAIDDEGNVLVADWGNNRIQVFDSQGSFLSFVNSLADPIYGPQGLTITADGYVGVADSGNHCYKIYRYLS